MFKNKYLRYILISIISAATHLSVYAADDVLRVDHFVPHISTVPVNAGTPVGLYVRERVLASVVRDTTARK